MFCNQCGCQLDPQTNTCPYCSQNQSGLGSEATAGQWTAQNSANYRMQNSANEQTGYYANSGQPYSREPGSFNQGYGTAPNYGEEAYSIPRMPANPPRKNSTSVLTGIAIALVIVLILGIGGFAAYKFELIPGIESSSTENDSDKTEEPAASPQEEEQTPAGKNTKMTLSGKAITQGEDEHEIEKALNSYISENFNDISDVAVCVIDNKTDIMYSTKHAADQYTAWGFYLPIYMALNSEYPGSYDETRSKIMSTDMGVCNVYSNNGIDYLGGFASINSILAEDYNLFGTTYGRKFGDVNSKSDNYTTPEDGAMLLKELNDYDDYRVLAHSGSSYGIYPPGSEYTIYAHYGSENRYVNKTFNVFSIVKGRADCCIVVMTKNQTRAPQIVNEIYSIILSRL